MAGHPLTINWSAEALADLQRFADFLQEAAPHLASSVATEIVLRTRILGKRPMVGRAIKGTAYREFVIRALKAPYVLQYLNEDHRVLILRVFHGREKRD